MVEHVDGGHLRIDAEFLRQVAQDLANLVLLRQHVEAIQGDGSRVGILQRGDSAHERAFARAVRAEQPEHVVADGQGHIFERANAVGIGLGETGDGERHRNLLLKKPAVFGCSRILAWETGQSS